MGMTTFFVLLLASALSKNLCPPLNSDAENGGRCGPLFGSVRCNKLLKNYALYCNSDNGWCGDTSAHENAQSDEDRYDWAPDSCEAPWDYAPDSLPDAKCPLRSDGFRYSGFNNLFIYMGEHNGKPYYRGGQFYVLSMRWRGGSAYVITSSPRSNRPYCLCDQGDGDVSTCTAGHWRCSRGVEPSAMTVGRCTSSAKVDPQLSDGDSLPPPPLMDVFPTAIPDGSKYYVFNFDDQWAYWCFLGIVALALVTSSAVSVVVCLRATAAVQRDYARVKVVSDSANDLL